MRTPTRSTAFHEAGHAVAAAILGLGTAEVSVRPHGDASGHHTLTDDAVDRLLSAQRVLAWMEIPGRDACPFETEEEAADALRQHVKLLQAGEEAQRRAVPTSYRHHHVAHGDHDRIIDLALLLTGGNAEAVEGLDAETRSETRRLLDEHWPAVERVAEALLDRETLTGADVGRILDELEVKLAVRPAGE